MDKIENKERRRGQRKRHPYKKQIAEHKGKFQSKHNLGAKICEQTQGHLPSCRPDGDAKIVRERNGVVVKNGIQRNKNTE